ncbi:MAG TPA: HEAT repeat domain-containing protein [Actinobacteria bacterium]|nr:hypothetical protein BMS3Bbin01_00257 [bacterium BMS3Bbin01]HDH26424.1 HEAT repeat domain-containing protein [Actinomycetota bacterium]
MGFKEDADFARFVSMGAVGTAAVADHLREKHGHYPIELERYAMANKVWQTKVKRLRLPDLVCTRCGLRVESRAKSKLGLVLSHSDVRDRAWDAGGMRGSDLYAFLRADLSTFPPYVSLPFYFTTAALRDALDQAKRSAPKAASEGSEITLTWPTWVPARSGAFSGVDEEDRLVCEWDDGKVYRYWQWRNWEDPRFVYLDQDQEILAHETILAGVVSPPAELNCPGDVWDLKVSLESTDSTDRYAAIRATGVTGRVELTNILAAIVEGEDDWRIRLEATASLAMLNPGAWTDAILDIARDIEQPQDLRIEATFVLSELRTTEALDGLATVCAPDSGCPSEIRAAAAWGLGQGRIARPEALLPLMDDEDLVVRLHAVVALEDLPSDVVEILRGWLSEGKTTRAATATHLLQRHHEVEALLTAYESGGVARLWAIRALGALPEAEVRKSAGTRLTDELEVVLVPFWLGQNDWVRGEGQAGVDALDIQKIRFDPYGPTPGNGEGHL